MNTPGYASIGLASLVLTAALAGCDTHPPTAATTTFTPPPPPPTPPAEVRVLVFTDPVSGLQTSDVRDADGQIVQFNSAGTLIWMADGTEFPAFPKAFGYDSGSMEVLWGAEKGARRAYLTFSMSYWHYPPPASLVDLEVLEGTLVIRHPDPPVPLPGS